MHRYNRYLAVAAQVVRRSLNEEKRLIAERRGVMEMRFAKWEVCAYPFLHDITSLKTFAPGQGLLET
jgi:hypothetical protein